MGWLASNIPDLNPTESEPLNIAAFLVLGFLVGIWLLWGWKK